MLFTRVAIFALATLAAAHPVYEEEEHLQSVRARAAESNIQRTLEGCASQLENRRVYARAMKRRKATFHAHRTIPLDAPYVTRNRMVDSNTTEVLDTDHPVHPEAFDAIDSESSMFSRSTSAVLEPLGDWSFRVPAEHVRGDLCSIEECARGVFVMADIQLINLDTCEPMSDVWADVWSCNATGVHSINRSDAENLNSTALRGVQRSDPDGVFRFSYNLPGHYAGRTTHHHIVVHEKATVLSDGSLVVVDSGSHMGRLPWDQAFIDEIENTTPRTTNLASLVSSKQETVETNSDPIYSHILFGEDVASGIFAWTVIGVDPSASYTAS